MSTYLKDRTGVIKQRLEDTVRGIVAFDRSGRLLGTFDKVTNRTTDRSGRLIGTGNHLASL